MKETPYLDFYYKCMEAGQILPMNDMGVGLCGYIQNYPNFKLIVPTKDDYIKLDKEDLSLAYWGSGNEVDHPENEKGFTPLRQTIVLFLAAINNEL